MPQNIKNDATFGYYMDLEDSWIGGRRVKEAVITHVDDDGTESRVGDISFVGPAHPRGAFDEAGAIAKLWPAILFLREYMKSTGKRFELVDKRSLAKVVAARGRRKKP